MPDKQKSNKRITTLKQERVLTMTEKQFENFVDLAKEETHISQRLHESGARVARKNN